jgi:hypothetical protein
VARVAQELAGQVRSWLERTADYVLDKMQPTEPGLAYEGGGDNRERPQDLADRLREAWAVRDQRSESGDKRSDKRETQSEEREASQSLADRLRSASKGLDHEEIAARLAAIRQGREVAGHDPAREAERVKAEELECEARRGRDRGLEHGL